MEDREILVATLRKLSRRLRVNRALAGATLATSLLLILLIGLELLPLLTSFPSTVKRVVRPLLLAGWAGWLTWNLTRRESLARAAGVADRGADLKDGLKTAFWFISQGEISPWVETQIRWAADAARRLDVEALVPVTVPRTAPVALGLLTALGLLFWLAPAPLAPAFGPAEPLSEEETAKVEDIRNLLRDSAGRGDEENLESEALENLEQTFRLWERGEISREDALGALQEATEAMAEGELDSAALREDLGKLGDGLKGAELAALAEALKKAHLGEAADLLRSLADKLSEPDGGQKLRDLLERLARSPSTGNADLDKLLAKLREAAENATGDPEGAKQSLESAAADFDALATRMAGDQRLGAAGRQLQVLGGMMEAREAAEGAERFSAPGEPGGSSAGPPGGTAAAEPTAGESTRLAVQLEMEKLASRKRLTEPEPEEISHEATREERSKLGYREVGERAPYGQAEAMSAERIPWRYRQMVRDYFMTLRPSAEK